MKTFEYLYSIAVTKTALSLVLNSVKTTQKVLMAFVMLFVLELRLILKAIKIMDNSVFLSLKAKFEHTLNNNKRY